MSLEKILEKLATRKERVIELHSGLTSHIAMSPKNGGDGEWEKAKWYENKIKEYGLNNVTHYDAPDASVSAKKRPNLVVHVKGKSSKTLWVMGHFDVVPAGSLEMWNTNPFELTLDKDGDTMYGRGIEDNQQAIVSATLIAAELVEQNIIPELSLSILCVSDEETSNTFGIDYLMREYPDLVKVGDLLLVPDFGTEEGTLLEVAEKGVIWLKVTVKGKQCHASTPQKGINSLAVAAEMICHTPEIQKSFSFIDPLFEPDHTTITPTKILANVPNVNTLPGHDTFFLDCRVLPHYKIEEVIEAVKKHYAPIASKYNAVVEVVVESTEPTAPATSPEAEVVVKLQKAIEKVYNIKAVPAGTGGSTVAGRFRMKNIPAAVWARVHPTYHTPNEKGKISHNIGDAQVYAHILFEK